MTQSAEDYGFGDAEEESPPSQPRATGDVPDTRQPTGTVGADPAVAPKPLELVKLSSLVGPALDRGTARRSGDEKPVPVPFRGWEDALGGGLWPGAHFIVSGTGVGKSQLSIQTALGAAKAGVPVAYVGLELDEMQIALRVLAEEAGMRWSGLYTGRCSEADIARARGSAGQLEGLPFYVDFGSAHGWPASRLGALAQRMRMDHPTGPMLIVLDYLQLVGDEPAEFQRRPDLRERIGRAAYQARDVSRRFDVAVLMISSAARNHYGLLAGDFDQAGLTTRKGHRAILHPHVLLGLGKESGELEFSADTSTVLLRWPVPLENGETAILVAVPKVRAGPESWSALAFGGGRFQALPIDDLNELPPPPKRSRSGGKDAVSESDYEARVLATAGRLPTLKSKSAIANETNGTRSHVLAAVDRLVAQGRFAFGADGVTIREGAY